VVWKYNELISSKAVGIATTFPYSERAGFLMNLTGIILLSYVFPDKVRTARIEEKKVTFIGC